MKTTKAKEKAPIPLYLIATGFILLALASIFIVQSILQGLSVPGQGGAVACTMEAKICPDGSAVGRTGPNCEFAPCPTSSASACNCPIGYVADNGVCNPGCYYSTPRCLVSSTSCQTTATPAGRTVTVSSGGTVGSGSSGSVGGTAAMPAGIADPQLCEGLPDASCQSISGCAICPPCQTCNSISCHSLLYCKSMGFDASWYNQTANPSCNCPSGYVKEGSMCNPGCYYSTPRCTQPSVGCSTQ